MENTVKELCRFILEHLNDNITLEKLEKEFYYNKYYIIRIFKSYTGYTIKEFINTTKILKTINPLIFTNDSILKIALNHGFHSQEYYSEKFQDVIGIPPLKFRKKFRDSVHNTDYLIYLNQYQNQLSNIFTPTPKIKKLVK